MSNALDGNIELDDEAALQPQPVRFAQPMAKPERAAVCVAMSEQRGQYHRGTESTPQGLVRLIGCRQTIAR